MSQYQETYILNTILPVFAAFHDKKLLQTATTMFCVSEQHDGDSFMNESMNRLNDSVQSQRLTC